MTLDEAIKHAEEVADSHDRIKQIKAVTLEECRCAEEHRQLAEWLKDYKRLKEQEPCENTISRQALLDKIKRDIFNACSDNYHMPVHNLDCDAIFEIIDKYKAKSEIKK